MGLRAHYAEHNNPGAVELPILTRAWMNDPFDARDLEQASLG
jgi:hypothetical protein